MKRIVVIFALLLAFQMADAKNYTNAIGLKGGAGGGITYKHFFTNTNPIEFDLSFGDGWLFLLGNYQWHFTTSAKQFEWYLGVGAHAFNISTGTSGFGGSSDATIVGVNGLAGLEYAFKEVPFVISVDITPMYTLGSNSNFLYWSGGLGIKYYW